MTVTRFDNVPLPPEERFASWREAVSKAPMACLVRSQHEDDFPVVYDALKLDDIRVTKVTCPAFGTHRTTAFIRRSDPEVYRLNVTLNGRCCFVHGGTETTQGTDELFLQDSSVPCRDWLVSGESRITNIGVEIPRGRWILAGKAVAPIVGIPFTGHRAMTGMLVRHLVGLFEAADYTPADKIALGRITADLLAATLASALRDDRLAAESVQRTLPWRIHEFIEANLGDRELSPQTIADAHHMSVRRLHTLFQGTGMTVAAHIRHRRLERCRQDLTAPHLLARPVQGVAARWGFTNAAHFSRLFRAAYGASPSDYRHDVLARGRSSAGQVPGSFD
ncbi:helix-turn-helix domain-containing protein [Spirillospora sp. NPDC048911]|uniref:helix-turn-helix domain-containing protein n=1 Tax=Spirillospora sp. NPDC048911 TaxID=3364527 RepID=UPI00371F6F75